MASTTAGLLATQAHRRDTVRRSALVVREVLGLWTMLDPLKLDKTSPAWLRLMLDLLDPQRRSSADSARTYYSVLRRAEAPSIRPFTVPSPRQPDAWREAARTSLLVTGPIAVRQLAARGMDPAEAADQAAPGVAAAAARHVAAAGRRTIDTAVRTDPAAIGWRRITGADPCSFCAMLASRGDLYLSKDSAQFADRGGRRERYHDGCNCVPQPVFRRGAPLPDASAAAAQLWSTVTKGLSGRDARNAFRRAHEAQQRSQPPTGSVRGAP
ncbi:MULTISPECIES: hypothetical protein [unclassified Crossiella]|uniref:VG15 protein n=1 Tax=unclassified Crossiella TaxID=2620835 RepID=UPI001FFE9522|nr:MULTISPECIES: hypothetical protein [unclassified Crossiella]MCK2237715.1 hypothetical protein [Crossiella sp. S99.2]MCK2255001.1 hypothetical protein [Crossiella sp. S99.1]